jgi:4-hydroxybenzoate polyprenyltransferase
MTSAGRTSAEAARGRGILRLLLREMRPHQWVKNLFVLAPLLFGRKLTDPGALADALSAYACFCLMASALYIVNDIVDAAADRAHPEKRLRPIASGALPVTVAGLSCAALLATALWLAVGLGAKFLALAAIYLGSALGYSMVFKRVIVLDAIVIASGFVLRVAGGAAAVEVEPTHWLIACAFLLALYLAFAKRRQELLLLADSAIRHRRVLGRYTVGYLEQVNNILLGATLVAYMLYTVAPETVARFGTDRLIYGTLFVVYGLLRYMALIQDPSKGGNPSKLLMSDKPLLLAVTGWALYNALVIYRAPIVALWERLS